jgi:hypothetical protein
MEPGLTRHGCEISAAAQLVFHIISPINQPINIDIMAARKRTRTGKPTQSNIKTSETDSQSEMDIAIVSTTDNSQLQPAEPSPGTTTVQPQPSSQPAPATQSSNSEDNRRKTTSNIWADFVQSGQGMNIFTYFDLDDEVALATNKNH